jgi:hypothetical protein
MSGVNRPPLCRIQAGEGFKQGMNTLRQTVLRAGLAGLLLASCSALGAQAAGNDDAVDERQPLSAGGSVTITDHLPGSVTVSAWNEPVVGVSGESGCSQEGWQFDGTPAELNLTVKLPTHSRNVADCELRVRLPADARLTLKTISADVSLSGAQGPLRISTVSGDLTVQSQSQDVSLQTVSGDLHVAGVQGKLAAKSASGNLSLSGATLSELKVETVSGDIQLGSAYAPHAHGIVNTVSGTITLHVQNDPPGSVQLKTFSGSLPCETDGSAERPRRPGFKTCEYGQADGKGASLVLTSQSGDLKIDGSLGAAAPSAPR